LFCFFAVKIISRHYKRFLVDMSA